MSGKAQPLSWTVLERAALLYLGLPVFIFLLFWFNAPWNIFFVGLAGWGIWQAMRPPARQTGALSDSHSESGYSWKGIGWVMVVALLIALLFGVGSFMPQAGDYEKSNCFFSNLTLNHWPWEYRMADGKLVDIVYYFGYYMLPGLLGSLGGPIATDVGSVLMAVVGLTLGVLAFVKFFKIPLAGMLLLLGFNGLGLVGNLFTHQATEVFGNLPNYTFWAMPFKLLFPLDVFLQAPHHLIASLVVLPLVLRALETRRGSLAIGWMTLGLFWSPLDMIGVGIVALWSPELWRGLLRWSVLGIVLGVLAPIAVFFSIKIFSENIIFLGNHPLFWKFWPLFICLEWLLWFPFIRKEYWKQFPVLWVLCAVPVLSFWTMGMCLDWLYRLGFPLQLFVYGLVIKSVLSSTQLWRKWIFAVVYCLVALESAYALGSQLLYAFLQASGQARVVETRRASGSFMDRLSPIAGQYVGDRSKNILSKILLRASPKPIEMPVSWDEWMVRVEMWGWQPVDNEKGEEGYLCGGTGEMFFICPYNSASGYLSFRLSNGQREPMRVVVGSGKNDQPWIVWKFESYFERAQRGERVCPLAKINATKPKLSVMEGLGVPDGGMEFRIPITLSRGITELAWVREPGKPYLLEKLQLKLETIEK